MQPYVAKATHRFALLRVLRKLALVRGDTFRKAQGLINDQYYVDREAMLVEKLGLL